MKKLLVVLAAGLLVCGVAGQAKATFTGNNEDLIRVMYDATTHVEIATDMGSITTLEGQTNYTSFDKVGLSNFGSGASWSNVEVAYFGIDTTSNTMYIAGNAGASSAFLTAGPAKWSGFNSAMTSLVPAYQAITPISGDPNSVSLATSAGASYYQLFDKGGSTVGAYAGVLPAGYFSNTEVTVANGGSQYLWQIVNATASRSNTAGQIVTAPISVPTGFTIVTNTDGTTSINPAATTPIPPSILLMGSGLLGLIGIGRRKFFA